MNKTYTVTINNLTESDMRDIFYEAIEKLGVKAGEKIPSDMVNLREAVIRLMLEGRNEEKWSYKRISKLNVITGV